MEVKISGAHIVLHKLVRTGKYKKNMKCIQDEIQAVLLCKRTQDAPMHPGYWSLFGGKLKPKEEPEQAVRRELEEELEITGQSLQGMKQLCNVSITRKQGTRSISYLSSPLDVYMDGLRLKRNKKEKKVEGEGLGWFTAEEVHHLTMRPEDRIAVTKFFRETGV